MAQNDAAIKKGPAIEISGYADLFYCYDFNKPNTGYRQPFLYNHNRHKKVNLNHGLLKLSVENKHYRAGFGLHAGTYVNDNYAAEPEAFQNIYEATAGISLNKKQNLWADAGIFSSHIGFESAISPDNLTLTRSLLAENSPYYLAGAKISYAPNGKLELTALVCNGWQRIKKVKGNSLPAFGTQLKILTGKKSTINWSTFIGTDDPDSTRRMRFFNNFYGLFQPAEKISVVAGFDIGFQQQSFQSKAYHYWLSPVCMAAYRISPALATAIRLEYYHDPSGVVIPAVTPSGFRTGGLSLNLDYSPVNNIFCRIEGRILQSRDKIFEKQGGYTQNNFFITASIAVKFRRLLSKPRQADALPEGD